MFGRIENGVLIPAPRAINADRIIDGRSCTVRIYNPKADDYKNAGYLEVIEAPCPEDEEKYFEKHYAEKDGKIVSEWVECDAPVKPITLEERVSDCENALVELAEIITEGE